MLSVLFFIGSSSLLFLTEFPSAGGTVSCTAAAAVFMPHAVTKREERKHSNQKEKNNISNAKGTDYCIQDHILPPKIENVILPVIFRNSCTDINFLHLQNGFNGRDLYSLCFLFCYSLNPNGGNVKQISGFCTVLQDESPK